MNLKLKKIIKWSLIVIFGIIFLRTIASSPTSKESFEKGKEAGANVGQKQVEVKSTPSPKPIEKFNVVVTSQIVKKVDGKYRYFFDIRNKDNKNFEGEVSISLFNELSDKPLGGDTFKTNKAIEPEIGTSQYIDIYTAPTEIHGVNGISKFKYFVKKDGQTINQGDGKISEKYEDLN